MFGTGDSCFNHQYHFILLFFCVRACVRACMRVYACSCVRVHAHVVFAVSYVSCRDTAKCISTCDARGMEERYSAGH